MRHSTPVETVSAHEGSIFGGQLGYPTIEQNAIPLLLFPLRWIAKIISKDSHQNPKSQL